MSQPQAYNINPGRTKWRKFAVRLTINGRECCAVPCARKLVRYLTSTLTIALRTKRVPESGAAPLTVTTAL
ncbi:MAG: hypothetical protein ACREEM_16830 [Blastocatellia bacterium]